MAELQLATVKLDKVVPRQGEARGDRQRRHGTPAPDESAAGARPVTPQQLPEELVKALWGAEQHLCVTLLRQQDAKDGQGGCGRFLGQQLQRGAPQGTHSDAKRKSGEDREGEQGQGRDCPLGRRDRDPRLLE